MSLLQVITHSAPRVLVGFAGALNIGQRRNFGDRDVPPRIIAADALLAIDGNHDDADAGALLRRRERTCDLVAARRAFGMRSHGCGVRDEIDLDDRSIELAGGAATPVAR